MHFLALWRDIDFAVLCKLLGLRQLPALALATRCGACSESRANLEEKAPLCSPTAQESSRICPKHPQLTRRQCRQLISSLRAKKLFERHLQWIRSHWRSVAKQAEVTSHEGLERPNNLQNAAAPCTRSHQSLAESGRTAHPVACALLPKSYIRPF